MKFLVTPCNVLYCPIYSLICTDDYTSDEISRNKHITDIKHDFDSIEMRTSWKSKFAFVYPITSRGVDCKHYDKIALS